MTGLLLAALALGGGALAAASLSGVRDPIRPLSDAVAYCGAVIASAVEAVAGPNETKPVAGLIAAKTGPRALRSEVAADEAGTGGFGLVLKAGVVPMPISGPRERVIGKVFGDAPGALSVETVLRADPALAFRIAEDGRLWLTNPRLGPGQAMALVYVRAPDGRESRPVPLVIDTR